MIFAGSASKTKISQNIFSLNTQLQCRSSRNTLDNQPESKGSLHRGQSKILTFIQSLVIER